MKRLVLFTLLSITSLLAVAQKDTSDLKTVISSNFPDNTAGFITPERLRTVSEELMRSSPNKLEDNVMSGVFTVNDSVKTTEGFFRWTGSDWASVSDDTTAWGRSGGFILPLNYSDKLSIDTGRVEGLLYPTGSVNLGTSSVPFDTLNTNVVNATSLVVEACDSTTIGQVLANTGGGLACWADPCCPLDDAYDSGGAGAGRTITADAGAVEIDGNLLVSDTVGIGTSAPTATLDVLGDVQAIRIGGSSQIKLGTTSYVFGGFVPVRFEGISLTSYKDSLTKDTVGSLNIGTEVLDAIYGGTSHSLSLGYAIISTGEIGSSVHVSWDNVSIGADYAPFTGGKRNYFKVNNADGFNFKLDYGNGSRFNIGDSLNNTLANFNQDGFSIGVGGDSLIAFNTSNPILSLGDIGAQVSLNPTDSLVTIGDDNGNTLAVFDVGDGSITLSGTLGMQGDVNMADDYQLGYFGTNSLISLRESVTDATDVDFLIYDNDLAQTFFRADAGNSRVEINGSLQLTNGSQGAGKVLTSDASGNATWTHTFSYGEMGFGDSTATIALTQNTPAWVTNGNNDLWSEGATTLEGITYSNDSLICNADGIYEINLRISGDLALNDVLKVGVYKNGSLSCTCQGQITSPLGGTVEITYVDILSLSADDALQVYITNTANNNDFDAISAKMTMHKVGN